MTPEQRLLRDAYLAELWPTVREYHDGDPLPKRPVRRRARRVDNVGDSDKKRSA
jgi:hypothetical protein